MERHPRIRATLRQTAIVVSIAASLAVAGAQGDARAERILYASAGGTVGYIDGRPIHAPRLDAVLSKLGGRLAEQTVIQLLGDDPGEKRVTVFRMEADPCNFQVAKVEGTPEAPLVIRGIRKGGRWLVQIAGDSIDDIVAKRFSCRGAVGRLGGTIERGADADGIERDELAGRLRDGNAGKALGESGTAPLGAGVQYRRIPCFHVTQSRHIAFENLHFKDCWASAIFIADSSNVSVADNLIEGSSYAVFATTLRAQVAEVRGFVVERNIWIQDNSGYGPGKPARCRESGRSLDCPGLVWTTIPWAVTHETWYQHMNGALFGSFDIGGGVVFRGNKVTNAYNGIRMVVGRSCNRVASCREAVNRDVEVIDNDFIYIRDNPVEPETRAVNWTIARNRIVNAHAWFSLDDVAGGPIYIWGNVGWYTEIPGRLCRDDPKFKRMVRVDFEQGGYRELAAVGEAAAAFVCARSRFGTIIKEGSEGAALDKDVYVFHNSWYARIPLLREGKTGRIKYWNNAMVSTGCGVSPNPMCGIELSAGIEDCRAYRDFVTDDGSSMLLRCIDAGRAMDPRILDFRFNIANKGFPADFLAAPGRKDFAFAADPGFRAPAKGDFRLRPGSPAIGRGCIVEWDDRARGSLRCRLPGTGEAGSDLGAYSRDGRLYSGPE